MVWAPPTFKCTLLFFSLGFVFCSVVAAFFPLDAFGHYCIKVCPASRMQRLKGKGVLQRKLSEYRSNGLKRLRAIAFGGSLVVGD